MSESTRNDAGERAEQAVDIDQPSVDQPSVDQTTVEPPDPTAGVPDAQRLGLPAKIEALLFLSNEPLGLAQLVEACESSESKVEQALSALEDDYATGRRGLVLRRISGGWSLASAPGADAAAKRLFAKPRTPPLTQAQAECLAVIAYLQPVSRPEVARIRGVSSESALATLLERGLVAETGRSRFGAVIFRTTELFDRLFGLEGLDMLPDVAAFDPSPEDERSLRERLLKAGEARAAAAPGPAPEAE
jgi:segregation and condensation protein B